MQIWDNDGHFDSQKLTEKIRILFKSKLISHQANFLLKMFDEVPN
jgi:hypothetical protein